MIMAFALGITVCALAMILYFGPEYIDAKIDKAVAQTEGRMRGEVAQAEVRIRTEAAQGTADARATAHLARTQALVALDKVEDMRVKFVQRNTPLDGH